MTANQLALWYLAASVLFILALKGLSHPESARRGNLFGMVGMAIAVLVTRRMLEMFKKKEPKSKAEEAK
jgi:NAD(P) transhydrogenase subunit beta